VVERAKAQGVELFALTDHDETGGLAEAASAARELGLNFVPGVEVSVTWGAQTVHIVGLGIDPANAVLVAGLAEVRSGRLRRAHEMADGLAAAGIPGALDGALAYAGNLDLVSRTHFARWLVSVGVCDDLREVFGKYLVAGKPGYVPHRWATLRQAIEWIRGAGGVAVIAHPGRYRFNDTELWAFVSEFRDAGGDAVEVATSNHSADQVRRFTRIAREFGLAASRGSDFHSPNESHVELGRVFALPDALVPVWARFA
jgi:predicted metal-dependent phosphoesterase TrpH